MAGLKNRLFGRGGCCGEVCLDWLFLPVVFRYNSDGCRLETDQDCKALRESVMIRAPFGSRRGIQHGQWPPIPFSSPSCTSLSDQPWPCDQAVSSWAPEFYTARARINSFFFDALWLNVRGNDYHIRVRGSSRRHWGTMATKILWQSARLTWHGTLMPRVSCACIHRERPVLEGVRVKRKGHETISNEFLQRGNDQAQPMKLAVVPQNACDSTCCV